MRWERSSFVKTRSVVAPASNKVICHCIGVTDTQINGAIAGNAARCVKTVMECTGAGSGCTACHCAIKDLLNGVCPQSPSDSPICIAK